MVHELHDVVQSKFDVHGRGFPELGDLLNSTDNDDLCYLTGWLIQNGVKVILGEDRVGGVGLSKDVR